MTVIITYYYYDQSKQAFINSDFREKMIHLSHYTYSSVKVKEKVMNLIIKFTFPKGETNCWSAVILSPIFSFLTYQTKNQTNIFINLCLWEKKVTQKLPSPLFAQKRNFFQAMSVCTLKGGIGDGAVSFRGLLLDVSLLLFFPTVAAISRTSNVFCSPNKKKKKKKEDETLVVEVL